MRYGIVDPIGRIFETLNMQTFEDALFRAGLKDVQVDHGVLVRGVGIVVFEHWQYVPVTLQSYFAFDNRLWGGFAVLYGYDWQGRTCNLAMPAELIAGLRWLSAPQVEDEISKGTIDRPCIAVNGKEIWHWPEPLPASMGGADA